MDQTQKTFKFQVVLSFAGEDREYVEQVANFLKSKNVSSFYDNDQAVELWGKDLYVELQDIYQNQSLFAVMFISKNYKNKMWTNHERQAMQARAIQDRGIEYILPAMFDDTEIPGLLPTVGRIDLRSLSPQKFGQMILEKMLSSGQSIPSEQFRKSLVRLNSKTIADSTNIVTVVSESNYPIEKAHVVAVAPNGIILEGHTDSEGKVEINFPVLKEYTLIVAHPKYLSAQFHPWTTSQDITVFLSTAEGAGSIICKSTCYIPDFSGRLNVISDTSQRTYLYADNISMNGMVEQPYDFKINDIMELEDAAGQIINLQITYIKGKTSLLQFKRFTK